MPQPAKNQEHDTGGDACDHWATKELATTDLGDARRTQRLQRLVTLMANRPGATIPDACGTWAETKAAYRFFSNPAIDPDEILAGHREATLQRINAHDIILAVQDTTYLSFPTLAATDGLGPIGNKGTPGLLTHACLAVSTTGVPLGVLGEHTWARPPKPKRQREKQRRNTGTENKESQRWLDMLDTSTQGMPSTTRVVAVADREADIYGFLDHANQLGQEVLVRSCYNRATDDGYAWDQAEARDPLGTLDIEIERSGNRPARTATLEIRSTPITVKQPDPRRHRRPGPTVELTMIIASEPDSPEGVEPVSWRLLTSLPAAELEDAVRCVQWYALRWRIERFFFVLKSGCGIEDLQLKARDRIERALAVFTVVAWRLQFLTHQARHEPQASCEPFLSLAEWRVAYAVVHKTKTAPEKPPSLREGVRLVARLGGFLARKGDGEPGVKTLWRGLTRLHDMVMAVETVSEPQEEATYG